MEPKNFVWIFFVISEWSLIIVRWAVRCSHHYQRSQPGLDSVAREVHYQIWGGMIADSCPIINLWMQIVWGYYQIWSKLIGYSWMPAAMQSPRGQQWVWQIVALLSLHKNCKVCIKTGLHIKTPAGMIVWEMDTFGLGQKISPQMSSICSENGFLMPQTTPINWADQHQHQHQLIHPKDGSTSTSADDGFWWLWWGKTNFCNFEAWLSRW